MNRFKQKCGILLFLSQGCFNGSGLEGFPCVNTNDCGPKFICQQGYCVDSTAKESEGLAGSICSDGKVQIDEECDPGKETKVCDQDCSNAICGDGYTNMLAGELCDPGPEADPICDQDCTPSECGDEQINLAAGEECEGDGPIVRGICDSHTCKIDCIGLSWYNCNSVGEDGCEANILVDRNNCGGCGNICGGEFICVEGDCLEQN